MNFNIGITGLAGSGKDTLADILVAHTDKYIKASFAMKLKEVCLNFGWDGQKDDSGRKLWQTIGMAVREYSPNGWVNILDKYLKSNHPDKQYVFTDVRFKNEADYIKANKGIIIRVTRPSLVLSEAHRHISEAGQSEITPDYTIVNDGSLTDLQNKLFAILSIESNCSAP